MGREYFEFAKMFFYLLFFFANFNQVSTTVSGFRETDSIPSSINHSARSG